MEGVYPLKAKEIIMLIDPKLDTENIEIFCKINNLPPDYFFRRLEKGIYDSDSNFNLHILDKVECNPNINDWKVHPYGTCDDPDQLLKLFNFEEDERKFCLTFCKIADGSDYDGPYIGNKSPSEAVVAYHIYEILE